MRVVAHRLYYIYQRHVCRSNHEIYREISGSLSSFLRGDKTNMAMSLYLAWHSLSAAIKLSMHYHS